jgi:hypothetical protein
MSILATQINWVTKLIAGACTPGFSSSDKDRITGAIAKIMAAKNDTRKKI